MLFEEYITLSAPREAVWELLADTERLNREIGLPPIRFEFQPRPAGGTEARATVRVAGLMLRYREHPFEWVQPERHAVRRTFVNGPAKEISCGCELEDQGAKTRVHTWARIQPRNALSTVACTAIGRKSLADLLAGCRRFEAYLTRQAANPYARHSGKPPADHDRLRAAVNATAKAGADRSLAERLAEYAATAPPEDATLIRPYELADRWGVHRAAVLETCLYAARAGLLELRWRVLCPYCRGGPPGALRLRDLAEQVHCETCNIRYDARFDRSVEVCFSVLQAIRPIQIATYCIGGPRLSPHAMAQWILEPGCDRSEPIHPPLGGYMLTSLQAEAHVPLEIDEAGSAEALVALKPSGAKVRLTCDATALRPGGTLRLCNESAERVILRLESPDWRKDSATAAEVTSLQSFRDLFSSEVLSPGVELAVEQICVLFSDLKGSTSMYRERGDAASYRLVRDHFAWMTRLIGSRSGSVLKTAGDSVMAVFHDPADALAAALEMQREAAHHPDGLEVKVGLHWGPAIAVNANDTLDYFGQTVNVAARLQHESLGGDVVIAAEMAGDPQVATLLRDDALACHPFTAQLRGLDAPVEMLRLRLA